MAMTGILVLIVGVLLCGLMIAALVGVAWALSSNRKPPSP